MDNFEFKNKKVLVFGLGILGGGLSSARYFAKKGAIVTVTDMKSEQELSPAIAKLKGLKINYSLGGHKVADFLNTDLIIKNPAIPNNSQFLKIAQENKIPVETELSMFMKLYPFKEKIIGVTGTRGKSTTTMMIAKIINDSGKKAMIGGNIKDKGTLKIIEHAQKDLYVVLELSSWQLNSFKETSPHIAVLTNIYPDHLNRYKNMNDYIKDKINIFKYQTKKDYLVVNRENKLAYDIAKKSLSRVVPFNKYQFPKSWKLKLLGDHNLENASAAKKVAEIIGIPQEAIKRGLESFIPVPGRLQTIRNLKGVEIINDTTSTTPIATIVAIKSINKPIILILGGNTKNLDTRDLEAIICKKIKAAILLKGTGSNEIINKIQPKLAGDIVDDLSKAIQQAWKISEKGDCILFSPGFTSFGMFLNEFDRGEKFIEETNKLK